VTPRLNPHQAAPEAMKALVALENYVQGSGLDHSLIDDQARQNFSETELVKLTLRIAAINAWNRIAISFRAVHPTHWKGAA
jgi:alkylhydroperoxidase family enzyme